MDIPGRVQNGVAVLESGSMPPEGAAVTITYPAVAPVMPSSKKRRIQVPLVRTGEPGSVKLTNTRIAEIVDQDDASPRH